MLKNIDYGYSLEPPRRGGSNEYPQSMFLSWNKKIMYTPVNPSLLYESGVLGGQNYIGMFSWWNRGRVPISLLCWYPGICLFMKWADTSAL